MNSDRDRQRAKALKELLEANARWNQERRDAAKNDVRRIVDETGVVNPELQEAMLGMSQYLWWPHMHKYIMNLAEECRSCTRYGKNVKYLIPKNASKPLPLLTQPGQEVQLDYAGPLENHRGKRSTS